MEESKTEEKMMDMLDWKSVSLFLLCVFYLFIFFPSFGSVQTTGLYVVTHQHHNDCRWEVWAVLTSLLCFFIQPRKNIIAGHNASLPYQICVKKQVDLQDQEMKGGVTSTLLDAMTAEHSVAWEKTIR